VNLEKLKTEAGAVHTALYEVDASVLEKLKGMTATLAELAALDPQLQPIASQMKDATITIEESAFDLNRYLDRLDLDPGELDAANERLNTINRVLNKYGDTVEAALAHRADIGVKIDGLQRSGEDIASLQKQIDPLKKQLRTIGDELTAKRTTVAKSLGPEIEKSLAELGMEKATFTVQLSPAPAIDGLPTTPTGFDVVEFIARTNPGQLPQPLRKIASGGELSRIMLALKGILAQGDRVSVLVFDEIDSNVGGRLGSVIGNKLRALAATHQVLCITHLPQIASYADRHFTVRKEVVGGKTESKVRTMEGTERLQEIAEMIGGQRITDTTRAQAQELIDAARAEFAGKTTTVRSTPPAKKPKPAKA
jgi:DNA repair protein RecN (Recombination protein N)